jgi:hypothetical protein
VATFHPCLAAFIAIRPTARRFLERKELVSQAWRKREERLVQVGNIDDSNVLDDNSVIEA